MKTLSSAKSLLSCGIILMALSFCGAKTDSTEIELRGLELDIPSLYLINGMFFSADQTRQLANLLTQSAEIHEQNQETIRQFVLSHQRESELLIDRMIAGKKEKTAHTPPFAKGTQNTQLHKMRAEWQNLLNRSQGSLDGLARKTLAMLTPAQRDILERFVPCFIPPGDFRNPERVGQADGNTSLGETMLARLRRAPPAKLNDVIERALDGLVSHLMKEWHRELTGPQIDELRDELRPPLKELTDRVRGMNDSDFELEKANLARQFLSAQSTGRSGMNELEKVKRYLLNPGVVSIIAKRSGDPAAAFKPEVTPVAVLEDVREKNKAFQTAALINTLQLTAGQARQLLPCVRRASAAHSEIALEASAIRPQALKAYTALKKELENQQNSQLSEQEANKYHHQLKILYLEKLSKTILDCQSEMDRVLSADQVAFLAGHRNGKTCERNQIEQKKNISVVRSLARELFDKTDQMKGAEFSAEARNLCARFMEFCVSTLVIDHDDIDKEAEIIRAEQILSRARNMSRSEYLKARDDLIAEICPRRNKPRSAVFGWQKAWGEQLEVVDQRTQFLLSQTGLTLLEKKIKAGN